MNDPGSGYNLLHAACFMKNYDLAECLLKRFDSKNKQEKEKFINQSSKD